MRYPARLDVRLGLADFEALRRLAEDMNMTIGDCSRYCLVRGMRVAYQQNLKRQQRERAFRTDAESYKMHVLGEAEE
jgi:hypothetical protein